MKKIRASTLVLTVVIALLLSLICTSIILLAYFNRGFQSAWLIQERLRSNGESATSFVLADTLFREKVMDTLDLFEEGEDSVMISREAWGLFQVASITCLHNRFSYQRAFMYGKPPPGYMNACLYVADHKRNLFVVGKTKLTGDAYLSKGGIRPGFINQRGFDFDRPVDGEIKESDTKLPGLDSVHLQYLRNMLDQVADSGYTTRLAEEIPADTITGSFSDSGQIFAMSGEYELQDLVMKGKCVVLSDSIINVKSTATLENTILIAPVIIFKEGWSGCVQAFASDSIVVENNCSFDYPSALTVIKGKKSETQPHIEVGENCSISGILLTVAPEEDLYKTYIELGAGTVFGGAIYCQGFANIRGNINGVVMTDFFISRNGITTYENYLTDVEVNRKAMSDDFVMPTVFSTGTKRRIVQWLK